MTKKEQLINKIEGFENKYFNDDQKTIAIDILKNTPEESVQDVADFIFMKRKTGFAFDYSPELAKGRIISVREEESKRIDVGGYVDNNENKLIIGENYDALKLLQITHKKKIDIIYIDPPYNTESAGKDGNQSSKEGESKKFMYKDKFGRGGWLNMMKARLELAKKLLRNEGTIFVSIDDSEQAYLKVLMDDIFGEENFISSTPIELTKTQGMKVASAKNGSVAKNHEYVLMYSKKKAPVTNLMYDFVNYFDSHFGLIVTYEDDNIINLKSITNWINDNGFNSFFEKFEKKVSVKNIDFICSVDEEFRKIIYSNADKIMRISMSGKPDQEGMKKLETTKGNKLIGHKLKGYIFYMNSNGSIEQFQSLGMGLNMSNDFVQEFGRSSIRGTLWKGFYLDMMNVAKEGGVPFKNGKKPTRLIEQLIHWVEPNKDALILDFFAGSGTTGHAVSNLNQRDGGNRKFILVTNNEGGIADKITFPRLKNSLVNSKMRSLLLDSMVTISLDDEVSENLIESSIRGIKLLSPGYQKTDLNLYYDLAALNPLKGEM